MSIVVISVNLGNSQNRACIQYVLQCLTGQYSIEKIEFDDKINKVIVRGKFDALDLCKMIWLKAVTIVNEVKIVDVWPLPSPPPKEDTKLVPFPFAYPLPCQCPPDQCKCGKCPQPTCQLPICPPTCPPPTWPTSPQPTWPICPQPTWPTCPQPTWPICPPTTWQPWCPPK